jgi:hypothetical protein
MLQDMLCPDHAAARAVAVGFADGARTRIEPSSFDHKTHFSPGLKPSHPLLPSYTSQVYEVSLMSSSTIARRDDVFSTIDKKSLNQESIDELLKMDETTYSIQKVLQAVKRDVVKSSRESFQLQQLEQNRHNDQQAGSQSTLKDNVQELKECPAI